MATRTRTGGEYSHRAHARPTARSDGLGSCGAATRAVAVMPVHVRMLTRLCAGWSDANGCRASGAPAARAWEDPGQPAHSRLQLDER